MTADRADELAARRAERAPIIRALYPVGSTVTVTYRATPWTSKTITVDGARVVEHRIGDDNLGAIVLGDGDDRLTVPVYRIEVPERGIR